MDIFSASRFVRSKPIVAYCLAILLAGMAVWIRLLAGPSLFGLPFITFFVAVVLASLFAGPGPGVSTVALSTVLSTIALPAIGVVNPATLSPLAISIFALTGLFVVLLMSLVVRSVEDRDAAREGLRRAVANLDEAVGQRTEALRVEQEERLRAEQQIRQMQKIESIGQLTGGIAHDFNNMLAVVIGCLEMARRRLADQSTQQADTYVVRALDGAKKAAELTARLLAFARQQPLNPVAVEPNRLVNQMYEMLRRTLGETIEVECVLAPEAWRILIDAPQLESAIVNLAVNARDAMMNGGKLTVETVNVNLDHTYLNKDELVKPGEYLMIGVTDTGSGMSADVIERALEPFFTTKEVGKGTGLGLSQVYGFVKQSGGYLNIYSEPGVGTTVKIYLPRYLGEMDHERGSVEDPVLIPHAVPGTTVLLVEDDDRVRDMAAASLQEMGYEVVDVSHGRDALRLVESDRRIDLLLTDVVMPEMTGRQLADLARSHRPGLRVLYTTGYTRNAIVHNGVLDPGVAFLAKPYTLRQLALKVRATLEEHDPLG